MADKNPVAVLGVTDAQWNAADDAQKKAWMKQVSDAQANKPLSDFGSQATTSGASQVATAVTNSATSGTLSQVGKWFNIGGAMILGILLVVVGVVLIMRRQAFTVAFPEVAGVSAMTKGVVGDGGK